MSALATIGLPLASSAFQGFQARRANQANRRTQQAALGYLDQVGNQTLGGYAALGNWGAGQRYGATNQLLYGDAFSPSLMPDLGPYVDQSGANASAAASIPGGKDGNVKPMTPGALTGDLGGYAGRYRSLSDAAQARMDRGMGYLNTLSNQASKDINKAYDNNATAVNQRLVSSGLSNTSVAPALLSGNERQRADAQTRLSDQLARERMEADARFSQDVLNTRRSLSGDFLGALDSRNAGDLAYGTGVGSAMLGRGDSNVDRYLGVMTGYPVQGPPKPNPFDSIMQGLNNRQAYEASQAQYSPWDYVGPAAVGGLLGGGINFG